MEKIELSKVPMGLDVEGLIDWMLDKGYTTIINDFTRYRVEYDLSDLYDVWDNIRSAINKLLIEISK